MSDRQAKINSMAIATLLDLINNIQEGKEFVVEFDVRNAIVSTYDASGKQMLHYDGRTIRMDIK